MENIAYEESTTVLGVPYHRSESDASSHSYVDLKRDLNRLDEIPELRDQPALYNLVRTLNEPRGCFRSFGCERWHEVPEGPDQPHRFGSYVGFAIDAWPFESKQATLAIFHSFIAWAMTNPLPKGVKMLFELRPTVFRREEEVRGWSFDVWVWGFDETQDAARAAWERSAGFLDSSSLSSSRIDDGVGCSR